MKNIILGISLLFCTICLAQVQDAKTDNNIKVVLHNDGTWSYAKVNNSENAIVLSKYTQWVDPATDIIKDVYTETYSINKVIYINDGLKRPVSVRLLWKFGVLRPKITLKTINLIILQANLKSKSFCKSPKTYVPTGFYLTRSKDKKNGAWTFLSKFKGNTEYGTTGDYNKFFYFDKNGKFLNP